MSVTIPVKEEEPIILYDSDDSKHITLSCPTGDGIATMTTAQARFLACELIKLATEIETNR